MDEPELRRRVASSPVARLATVRADGAPHVVPVCFAIDGDRIVSVVDHKPKATHVAAPARQRPRAHPAVSLLVDQYDDDWARLWWVRVDGTATVCDDGPEHESAVDLLVAKYAQYRDVRPTGSVLEITAVRWLGWSAG